jgi:hypothetical protein
MHRVTIVAAVLVVAGLAVPSAAQSKNFAEDAVTRRRADAEALNKMIDCAVRSRAQDVATWVLAIDGPPEWPKPVMKAMQGCLSVNQRSSLIRMEASVSRGLFGMGFVRHPERLPDVLVVPPLPVPPTSDFAIVASVSACIVTATPAAARRFAEAISGLPEEREAFAAIEPIASGCIAPWPNLSINGPLLRAGLGFALFRAVATQSLPKP